MAERLDSVPESYCSDDDLQDDLDYYYKGESEGEERGEEELNELAANVDPEYYEFKCLSKQGDVMGYVDTLAEKLVAALRGKGMADVMEARDVLCMSAWKVEAAIERCTPSHPTTSGPVPGDDTPPAWPTHRAPALLETTSTDSEAQKMCPVCAESGKQLLAGASCGHVYCHECWESYIETQVSSGKAIGINCMGCLHVLRPERVDELVTGNPQLLNKLSRFRVQEYVKSHPCLRWCVGRGCDVVFAVDRPQMKRVTCTKCRTSCCFKCGCAYHCPTTCDVIQTWMAKCKDDSETAHYISANTKPCPECYASIEKSGGCNHMRCFKCKYEFCWMCMGPWKKHATEYYECSKYQANPQEYTQNKANLAREALKKYLHYYGRWYNHDKSLKLEEELLQQLNEKIAAKVSEGQSSWIDWQYIVDAAKHLTKCRYTLKYTYPYAYYMESGPRKTLFEYQQAQVEREIENLSWMTERAELDSVHVAELQQQMRLTEVQRQTLLRDFFA